MPSFSKKTAVFLLFGGLLLLLARVFDFWKETPTHADAWGYYVWLPATFIYHDLPTLDSAAAVRRRIHPGSMGFGANRLGLAEANETPKGLFCLKYTMGVAAMQAPFFTVGHLAAWLSGQPIDGFSPPYLWALLCSAIFWPLFGLFFLERTLRKYFTRPAVVWLVLFGLLFGTNLTYFSTVNLMSHAYLFSLFCGLIYVSDRFYDPKTGSKTVPSILIGLFSGLIALIRPTEIIALAIPLFWGIASLRAIPERLRFLWKNGRLIGLAALVFMAGWLPQLVYWHHVSGEWLHDSYPGERFDFRHPHLVAGIFGFKNGWLIFTPLMILAVVGLVFLRSKCRAASGPLLVFLPIHLLFCTSWWAWEWVNGFGSRPMVEAGPLLAFPLAATLDWFVSRRWLVWIGWLAVGFFVWLNLLQTWQWCRGIVWSQAMNAPAWVASFGKTGCSKDILVALEINEFQPSTRRFKMDSLVFLNDFDRPLDSFFIEKPGSPGQFCWQMRTGYSPGLSRRAKEIGLRPGDWLRVSVAAFLPNDQMTCDPGKVTSLVIEISGEKPVWRGIQIQNKIGQPTSIFYCGRADFWDEASFFIRFPPDFPPESEIKLYCWKPSAAPKWILLDDLKMERWVRR